MISVWYVFIDIDNKWLTESNPKVGASTSDRLYDAKEFHSETDAQEVAERHGGIVLGWCQ